MTDTLSAPPKKRIDAIDILRGLVMVIMALDHTRDFFMFTDYDPTDLNRASTALFLTRFITHYCAPTFVFLAGTGAFLSLSRGKTKSEASKFLLSRGLWLVVLEFTLIHFGWGGGFFLQVIWAIGISMMILGLLVYLPLPAIAGIGLLLIFGHNAFDGTDSSHFSTAERSWYTLLHEPGLIPLWGKEQIFVMYPLIPWVGVMAVGYAFGVLYKLDSAIRKKWLLIIGGSAVLLFIVIRYFDVYGDANHWTMQPSWYRTILSFINVSKYPPSLDYLLITLGPAILALRLLEDCSNKLTGIFVVFGRVPLFYYILHLYLIHYGSVLIANIANKGEPISFSLAMVYVWWLLAITILYFPCRWFMRYKQTHRQWWLSYL